MIKIEETIVFFANRLTLGGLEKVTVSVANELSKYKNVSIYSLKGDDFGFEFEKELNYLSGGNLFLNGLKHPISLLKAIVSKNLYNKKMLNINQVKADMRIENIDVIILSEADILFAKKIREINPTIRIIGWIHSTFESYRDVYMKDSYTQFIDNLREVNQVVVLTDRDQKSFSKIVKNVKKVSNPLTISSKKRITPRLIVTKKVGFSGRLVYENKGIDYLLKLAKLLPEDWIISIAGDGPDRERFLNDIEKNNIRDKFEFNGVLKGERLERFYDNIDILVLTSRWEGFGLVITEAMAFGIPVVAFDTLGSREIIGRNNDYGLIIENGNVEEMSGAIQKLASERKFYEYYSKKSLDRKEQYSFKNIIPQWLDIIDENGEFYNE